MLSLNTGASMPALGFGTWKLTGQTCVQAVTEALAVGYRHIDTAFMYGNHKEVGQAIKNSGVQRENLFITSKVWRDSLTSQGVINACNQTLKELGCEYLDMYLIHWPIREVPIKETLNAIQALKEQGLIKAIGVSNFGIIFKQILPNILGPCIVQETLQIPGYILFEAFLSFSVPPQVW